MNTSELEELYQQHFVTLFPFHLNYVEQILEFNKIEIVPGIFIEKCDHKHIGEFDYFWRSCPQSKLVLATILVTVYGANYREFLFDDLKKNKMNFNKFLDRLNRDKIFKNRFEIYDSINRHIIISMYLIKRISCCFTNNIISIGINSHGNAISANCGPHLMSIESPFYAFKKNIE